MPSFEIKPFVPTNYYIQWNNSRMKPLEEGLQLLIQYYKKKYDTNITRIKDGGLLDILAPYISKIRAQESGDYRVTFICGNSHVIPIIYIRENGREGLLIADSKGFKYTLGYRIGIQKLQQLLELPIPLYFVKDPRQADGFSCFTDAIVFGRDTTRKNEKNQYTLPNLLSSLDARAKDFIDYKITLLPDELLKTWQLDFFSDHKERDNKIVHIHKNYPETLLEFRKRYERSSFGKDHRIYKSKFQTHEEFKSQHINEINGNEMFDDYMVEKGLKFIDTIEIQSYINEIENIAKDKFTPIERINFIEKAKQELQKNNDISKSRIHTFTENFIDELMSKIGESTGQDHQDIVPINECPSTTNNTTSDSNENRPEESYPSDSITAPMQKIDELPEETIPEKAKQIFYKIYYKPENCIYELPATNKIFPITTADQFSRREQTILAIEKECNVHSQTALQLFNAAHESFTKNNDIDLRKNSANKIVTEILNKIFALDGKVSFLGGETFLCEINLLLYPNELQTCFIFTLKMVAMNVMRKNSLLNALNKPMKRHHNIVLAF